MPIDPVPHGDSPGGDTAHTLRIGSVARRFYIDGRSKIEIADELGISRFKVARLLDEARASGLVTIRIGHRGDLDVDLSLQLKERLDLAHALVMRDVAGGVAERTSALGALMARRLEEELTDDDVLALPWSRSVTATVRALRRLPPLEVVQLCGAHAPHGVDSSTIEVVVEAARLAGTQGHVFYAPLIVGDAATAAALRALPQVRRAHAAARRATRAVVGIGRWAAGASTVHEVCTPQEAAEVAEAGVVGETAGIFFDGQGAVVRPSLGARMVAPDADILAAVPEVTAVVLGADRAPAVRAAVAGGLVHSLAVDAPLARALLGS